MFYMKIILLILLLTMLAPMEYQPPDPCPEGCNQWHEMWRIKESKYCFETGLYILWQCHDYKTGEHYFTHGCFYNVFLSIAYRFKEFFVGPPPLPTPPSTPTPIVPPSTPTP